MSTTTLTLWFLTSSTILCFFTNSWLVIWALLEINTLAYCTMNFLKPKSEFKQTKESVFKYLMVQSIASSILILASIMKESDKNLSATFYLLAIMSLMLKMASSPLHYWFINVTKKSNWTNNLVLFTWQKIMPLYLSMMQPKLMMFPFILASSFTGSLFLMNKKTMKEIMALSSIFNLSWMIAATIMSLKILLYFSLLYWLGLIFFIKEISKNNKNFIEETSKDQLSKTFLFIKSINLAGVPPLVGFLAKWMVFFCLLKMNLLLTASFLLIMSSINMYIYLRLTSKSVTQNAMTEQKMKKHKVKLSDSLFMLANATAMQMFN